MVEHTPGGVPAFKDVEQDVEQAYYMSKMEPAMRDYLTQMRDEAYLEIKPGYVDTGASPNKRVFPIAYSAYTPPAPRKKKKVERTRFRETTHTFRQKSRRQPRQQDQATARAKAGQAKEESGSKAEQASMKPGKKEKIRFGKAPQETLPKGASSQTENAGALPQEAASTAQEPDNPLEASAPPEKKTRFSERAKDPKQRKDKDAQKDAMAPSAPDAAEVADRQQQSAPLGLGGDTVKTKKKSTATGEKTRLSDEKKKPADQTQPQGAGNAPQAPAPQAPTPAPPQSPAAPQ